MSPEELKKLPKWAQTEFIALEERLRLARALVWPTVPKPKPVDTRQRLEGKEWGTLFIGWFANSFNCEFRVDRGCCDTVHHSEQGVDETRTQGTGRFYDTKRDALLVCRWELCQRFAASLARLDLEMESAHAAELSEFGRRKKK